MPILDTSLHSLKRIYRGKVRDTYELDNDKLLIIATDRISAFDVILDDPIPYKGMVLQALTDFWFEKLKDIVPNHLTGIDPTTVVAEDEIEQVKGALGRCDETQTDSDRMRRSRLYHWRRLERLSGNRKSLWRRIACWP